MRKCAKTVHFNNCRESIDIKMIQYWKISFKNNLCAETIHNAKFALKSNLMGLDPLFNKIGPTRNGTLSRKF